MKLIYGLNISGESLIKYFSSKKMKFFLWDDDNKVRNKIKKKYKSILFINPKDKAWNKIKEAYVSPGISIKDNKLINSLPKKTHIYRDLDLYIKIKKNRKIISITGTNGKTTTVKLINESLKKNNYKNFVGGNYGIPLLESYNQKQSFDFHIIELSSYQLEKISKFKSYISILLNISDDHLDRYNSIQEYADIKSKIINSNTVSYGVISLDDKYCNKIYKKNINKKIKLVPISASKKLSKGIYINNNTLYDNFFEKKSFSLIKTSKWLKGNFNYQNILAAYAVNKILKMDINLFFNTVSNFVGLPHRSEILFEDKKLLIINNSKATNKDSLTKSLNNFENIFLITGGRIKNKNFSFLKKFKKTIIKCFIIGESTEFIHQQVKDYFFSYKSYNITKALDQIWKQLAMQNKKITILFAPGCSSFDQYKNFEERGNDFKKKIYKKI